MARFEDGASNRLWSEELFLAGRRIVALRAGRGDDCGDAELVFGFLPGGRLGFQGRALPTAIEAGPGINFRGGRG